MVYPNGSEPVMLLGPFSQLIAVKRCPCSDGRARHVRITGQPDTAFTIPASVKVAGKRISGFVTQAPTYINGVRPGYIFQASRFGKNAALLPDKHPWEG